MIIGLFLILIIIVILFNSTVYSIQNRCPAESIKIRYVRASRMPFYSSYNSVVNNPDNKLRQNTGIDMMEVKLDRDVRCGIYSSNTKYGAVTLYVAKNSTRLGYLDFTELDKLDEQTKKEFDKSDLFDMWDLDRFVTRYGNEFINTYNRGCC